MKKMFSFVLFSCFLLGCNKPYSIHVRKSDDILDFTIATHTQIIEMINSKTNFALAQFSNDCQTCVKAKEVIKKYIITTHKEIFLYNFDNSVSRENDPLYKFDKTTFPGYYPDLKLFKNGECMYTFNTSTIIDETVFYRVANQHII